MAAGGSGAGAAGFGRTPSGGGKGGRGSGAGSAASGRTPSGGAKEGRSSGAAIFAVCWAVVRWCIQKPPPATVDPVTTAPTKILAASIFVPWATAVTVERAAPWSAVLV